MEETNVHFFEDNKKLQIFPANVSTAGIYWKETNQMLRHV